MIHIYGKPLCPFCESAKQLCETEGFDYTYYQLDEDFTRDELMGIFPNARTFPQIHDDGTIIGGFDDFGKYVENEFFSRNIENSATNTELEFTLFF